MLDKLIGGIAEFGHGSYGHKNYRSGGGYGFEEHKEFSTHVESEGGYFDRQARYDRMRLPANHGRPPMAHMPVCDEDSDVEEFFESSQSHHTATSPHHKNNLHQKPPHLNYSPPPPVTQPHHNHHDGHGMQPHGGHGMQHHGGNGLKHHGGQGMQHHGGQGMQHHGGHGMQHHGEHRMQHYDMHGMHQGGHGMHQGGHGMHQGGHGMQHQGGHGMQHQGGYGMEHYGGGQGMKHHDRLMAPNVPTHQVYMNPNHGSGEGRTVMVKATENWRVSNSSGRKPAWGSKGL